MKKQGFQTQDFNVENLLSLMSIYLTEWQYRSDILWSQVFRYYYATLIVLFLPNMASFIGINLPNFPLALFPSISFFMSLFFLYVALGLTKRLEAIGKTYQHIINLLPPELRRVEVSGAEIKGGKFFNRRLSVPICYIMFCSLAIMSFVMIIYNIN